LLSQLLNLPCTVLQRSSSGSTTPYGRRRSTETPVETVCELQQQASTEPTDGQVADSTFLLILPAGTQISTGDAVVVDGHTYEITGQPWTARNPRTQTVSHIEAAVRRVAGAEETGS
jgi:hypothetical protein